MFRDPGGRVTRQLESRPRRPSIADVVFGSVNLGRRHAMREPTAYGTNRPLPSFASCSSHGNNFFFPEKLGKVYLYLVSLSQLGTLVLVETFVIQLLSTQFFNTMLLTNALAVNVDKEKCPAHVTSNTVITKLQSSLTMVPTSWFGLQNFILLCHS